MLLTLVIVYLLVTIAIGLYAARRVKNTTDFAIAGRHRLVLSPEEEFALTLGERGVPGQEGYSTSKEEQESILRAGSEAPAQPSGPPETPPTG